MTTANYAIGRLACILLRGHSMARHELFVIVFASLVVGCGAIAGPGQGGPTCVDHPSIETLATLVGSPTGLAIGGSNVYVSTAGYLRAVPKHGGSPVTLGVKGLPVATTATDVFVVTGAGSGAVFGLVRVPLDGGAPTPLVQNSERISSAAVDGGNVYYSVSCGNPPCTSTGGIYRVPISGGARVTLVSGPGFAPDFLVVDDTDVYWGSVEPGNTPAPGTLIGKVAKTGGSPVAFASGSPGVFLRALAVDQDAVYWSQQPPNAVMRKPKAGGPPVAVVMPSDTRAPLVLDASSVYWVDDGAYANAIMKAPKQGGAATAVARETSSSGSPPYIKDVAADSGGVYWTIDNACGDTTCQGKPAVRYLANACP